MTDSSDRDAAIHAMRRLTGHDSEPDQDSTAPAAAVELTITQIDRICTAYLLRHMNAPTAMDQITTAIGKCTDPGHDSNQADQYSAPHAYRRPGDDEDDRPEQPAYPERVLVPYQLPDGQIVSVDDTAAKGARVIGFTLKGGEIVQATRCGSLQAGSQGSEPEPEPIEQLESAALFLHNHRTTHHAELTQTGWEVLYHAYAHIDCQIRTRIGRGN